VTKGNRWILDKLAPAVAATAARGGQIASDRGGDGRGAVGFQPAAEGIKAGSVCKGRRRSGASPVMGSG
jgi:hypothetical protein